MAPLNSFSEFVTVVGITRTNTGSTRNGRRIVAHFDVELVGIQIRGCALIRTENDGVAISTPNVNAERAQRGVTIINASLRSAVTFAAREAYGKMGGTDLPAWALKGLPTVGSSSDAEAA